jgi:hypothetical protein
MALTSLHPESAGATPLQPANIYGFTKEMARAVGKQHITGHTPFAGLASQDISEHFEQAAALLTVLAQGLRVRAESPIAGGESDFDLLSPSISATALEGIASLVHAGVLLQRMAAE